MPDAMALPERDDIACGAVSLILIATLEADGERSVACSLLGCGTIVGGLLGPTRCASAVSNRNRAFCVTA